MVDSLQMLRGIPYKVNQHITITHPTVEDIINYGEERYWHLVNTLVATPYDYRVQLDDMEIDYEEIDDFTLFCWIFPNIPKEDTQIFFGDLDPSLFVPMNKRFESGDEIVLRNEKKNINIDKIIYELISDYIRVIHSIDNKGKHIAGNARTKQFYIEDARTQMELNKDKPFEPVISPLISAAVNCADFKYTYRTVGELPIYTFMDAVKHLQKVSNYRNVMTGVYTGNVNPKELKSTDLNWLGDL